jgi:succinoglycan biosynthesis transport protein ExoP
MHSDPLTEIPTSRAPHTSVPVVRAARHHLVVVLLLTVLGGVAGWGYLATTPETWTSSATVLVNPATGNPYAPVPSSVRQDEATSLETEAQVADSAEVLAQVSDETGIPLPRLEGGLQVVVPPNTQVLQLSYTAAAPDVARTVTDAVATAYLANRDRRFEEVNAPRLELIADRQMAATAELQDAAAAAQTGSPANQAFQRRLADTLRSEIVSLRAQRTALENSQSPGGSVISPASEPVSSQGLMGLAFPVGGLLLGLALGCLVAVLLERARGTVHGTDDVARAGLPVVAAVPRARPRDRMSHATGQQADAAVRRVRGALLDRDPRPDVVAVAPAGAGGPDAGVSEAVAASFARAGHRVVLVQTGSAPVAAGLAVGERGLAEALLHDRLKPLELLQPSVDPLLCLLPAGNVDEQTRDLLTSERLRTVLQPLVDDGHLVVISAPGTESSDGDEIVGAADLALVVVTRGRTRARSVARAVDVASAAGPDLVGLVVEPSTSTLLRRRAAVPPRHDETDPVEVAAVNLPQTMPTVGSKNPSKRNRR